MCGPGACTISSVISRANAPAPPSLTFITAGNHHYHLCRPPPDQSFQLTAAHLTASPWQPTDAKRHESPLDTSRAPTCSRPLSPPAASAPTRAGFLSRPLDPPLICRRRVSLAGGHAVRPTGRRRPPSPAAAAAAGGVQDPGIDLDGRRRRRPARQMAAPPRDSRRHRSAVRPRRRLLGSGAHVFAE